LSVQSVLLAITLNYSLSEEYGNEYSATTVYGTLSIVCTVYPATMAAVYDVCCALYTTYVYPATKMEEGLYFLVISKPFSTITYQQQTPCFLHLLTGEASLS
jgi:hypothetical protein